MLFSNELPDEELHPGTYLVEMREIRTRWFAVPETETLHGHTDAKAYVRDHFDTLTPVENRMNVDWYVEFRPKGEWDSEEA